ncbi:hypothetical protein ACFZAR_41200 [Streptomyces sp. NPDC008222]
MKLSSVLTDLVGLTGRTILEALVAGSGTQPVSRTSRSARPAARFLP